MGENTIGGGIGRRALARALSAGVALALGCAVVGARPATNTVELSGPQGGPFPSGSTTVALQNESNQPVVWHVRQNPAWASFASSSGSLPPWGQGSVEVAIDASVANMLPVGQYQAFVLHRGAAGQPPTTLACVRLTVEPAGSSHELTPASGLAAGGTEGGPVTPEAKTWSLRNTGASALGWSAVTTASWAAIEGSTSGTLAPDQAANLTVRLQQAQIASLPPGQHRAQLRVLRSADGALLDVRHIAVDILPAAETDGWTSFTPSLDTRTVYVSSSTGSDANSGYSPTSPKRTLAAGKALMRNGYPDWLLLKKGDVWTESLGYWTASGRSPSEPMLISSYGDSPERPYLRTGSSSGIQAVQSGSLARVDHVAIVGLRMKAHTYTGSGEPAGVCWLIESTGLLVEDCLIEGYQINVSVPGWGGRKRDVKIRRNVLVDAFATSGTVGHGIYLANCDTVLIEENVLDKNGWNDSVPGATPSMFRHGIYVQSGSGACTGVVVRGNIISNSASHGLHLRPGGVAEDNLFLRNSIALSLGGGNEPNPGGVVASARGNVILDGKNIDAANPRGWGIDLANIAQGTVAYNIVANQTLGTMPIPMTLYGDSNGTGVHNTLIERNVFYNWGGTASIRGSSTQVTSLSLRHNDLADWTVPDQILEHGSSSSTASVSSAHNRFYSTNPSGAWMRAGSTNYSLNGWKNLVGDTTSSPLPSNAYPAPTRSIASYHQTLGGSASHDAFMAEARKQSKAFWRPAYTAAAAVQYFREGFGMVVP